MSKRGLCVRDEQTTAGTAVEWGREEQQRRSRWRAKPAKAPGGLAAARVVIGVDTLRC